MVKGTSCRIAQALQGKNAGRENFQTDEADRRRIAPAGPEAGYWPRPSAVAKAVLPTEKARQLSRAFFYLVIGPEEACANQ